MSGVAALPRSFTFTPLWGAKFTGGVSPPSPPHKAPNSNQEQVFACFILRVGPRGLVAPRTDFALSLIPLCLSRIQGVLSDHERWGTHFVPVSYRHPERVVTPEEATASQYSYD